MHGISIGFHGPQLSSGSWKFASVLHLTESEDFYTESPYEKSLLQMEWRLHRGREKQWGSEIVNIVQNSLK